jgi:ketosteroid isomerase-like protein
MSARDLDALRSIYEAFNRRDLPAMLEHMHPDIEATSQDDLEYAALMLRLLGPRVVVLLGNYRGSEEVRRLFEAMWAISEHFAVEAEDFVELEEGIVVPVRLRATALDSGLEGEIPNAHAWTFSEGKATSLRVFTDRDRAISAMRSQRATGEE